MPGGEDEEENRPRACGLNCPPPLHPNDAYHRDPPFRLENKKPALSEFVFPHAMFVRVVG